MNDNIKKIFNSLDKFVLWYNKDNKIIFINLKLKNEIDNRYKDIDDFFKDNNKEFQKIILNDNSYIKIYNSDNENNKLEFFTLLSHELNTPLTCIIGYIDLLLNNIAGEFNETQKEFIEILKKNSEELSNKINHILDISEYISKDKIPIIKEKFFTEKFIQEIIRGFLIQAEKKKILFDYNISEDIKYIYNDKRKIKTILSEFIFNSIKNTDAYGIININIKKIDKFIEIEVKDNGKGIPKEEQDKIFILFTQVEQLNNRKTEGMGLGLYYCKKIVDNLGGIIEFISEEGKGSSFKIVIPNNF